MAQAKATPLGEAGAGCMGELTNHPHLYTTELRRSKQCSLFPRNTHPLPSLKIFHKLKKPKECWLLHRTHLTNLAAFYKWKAWGRGEGEEIGNQPRGDLFSTSQTGLNPTTLSTFKKFPNRFLNVCLPIILEQVRKTDMTWKQWLSLWRKMFLLKMSGAP